MSFYEGYYDKNLCFKSEWGNHCTTTPLGADFVLTTPVNLIVNLNLILVYRKEFFYV